MYHYFPWNFLLKYFIMASLDLILMGKPPLPAAREVFSSRKVSGSPDKVFPLEIPKNPYDFPVK